MLQGPRPQRRRTTPTVRSLSVAVAPAGYGRSPAPNATRIRSIGLVKSALPDGANAVYELVIDGVDQQAVEEATRVGIRAACIPGVLGITAGNYGGNLGPVHLHLHRLLQ